MLLLRLFPPIWVLEQAQAELGQEYPAYGLVDEALVEPALAYQPDEVRIALTRGLHVQSGREGLHGSLGSIGGGALEGVQHVYRAPVGIYISLEAPLSAQDIRQQVAGG